MSDNECLNIISDLSRRVAPALCNINTHSDNNCVEYHQAWTTLRLIGLISGAKTDRDFYEKIFNDILNKKISPNILIAGSADHTLFNIIYNASRKSGNTPEVTVVDKCQTALACNSVYANIIGARVNCVCDDLVQFKIDKRFDQITTHSVFGFMSDSDIKSFLKSCRRSITSHGTLDFVQAIRVDSTRGECFTHSPQEVIKFVDRAKELYIKNGPFENVTLREVERLSLNFAKTKKIRLFNSVEDFMAIIRDCGWKVINKQEIDRTLLPYMPSLTSGSDTVISLRVRAKISD